MPFKSRKQEKLMWAKHPKIAKKWTHKYGTHSERKVKMPGMSIHAVVDCNERKRKKN